MELHLRATRLALGLTLDEVSGYLQGTPTPRKRNAVARAELGEVPITLALLEQLGKCYHCHPMDLVSFPNSPPPREACQGPKEAS